MYKKNVHKYNFHIKLLCDLQLHGNPRYFHNTLKVGENNSNSNTLIAEGYIFA